jgi:predicted DNA-binding transcriptional regulator AlpA
MSRQKRVLTSELRDYVSSGDIAGLLGVTRGTVRMWWHRGILPPPMELGRRCLRWPRSVILDHLGELERRCRTQTRRRRKGALT